MYGEDGTQRVVYNLKEEHAEEGRIRTEKEEKKEKQRLKKKNVKNKRTVSISTKNRLLCQL